MDTQRRRLLAGLLASPWLGMAQAHASAPPRLPQRLWLAAEAGFPNSRWPVLFYPQAIPATTPALAEVFEACFCQHGWPPQWRYGMYRFDHFHATAHEALGIYRGHATVVLGGPQGRTLQVRAGDVLVLPAGTAHRSLLSSADYSMVGAYPRGQRWDLQRGDPAQLAEVRRLIAAVPCPPLDPLGRPLRGEWG